MTTRPMISDAATQDATAILTTVRNAALVRMEDAINRLTSQTATAEDFLSALDTEAGMKAVVTEYSRRLKEAAIEYINKHGPVETVTTRFYVGSKKTTKCRNVSETTDAIIQACGGDWERFVSCLSSQPLNHGECRGVLGDDWGRYFEVVEVPDLKTGKPQKELKRGLPTGKDEE